MAENSVQVTKVLLVAPQLEPRGTSEYTLNLAKELTDASVDVAVFCAPGPILDTLAQLGVPVQTFDHLEGLGLRFGEQKRFLRAVGDLEPQLVHAQSFRVASSLGLLIRRTSLPSLLTVHWLPARPGALKRVSRRLAGIIATTQAVREGLVNQCGVERSKIRVISNGIDVDRLEARDIAPIFRSQAPVVGSLGPIEEKRGHELFVRAASLLRGRRPDVQFVVAGEGDELPELRRLIANLGLERCVTLATGFSAYEDILDALDVVVQSSQVDVSGFSILEAMGHGRPVIAFNTGTACEIIEDRKTGLLVPKGDVTALAEAIEELIGDLDAARRIGERARQTVREKFNVQTIARKTLQFYADVLGA
ncbi:MAG: glycosyltransferase family 4 protein [Planctomycetota bacterium]